MNVLEGFLHKSFFNALQWPRIDPIRSEHSKGESNL